MAVDTEHQHRAGPFKQPNKQHKHGKHKSKGQMERDAKGRVDAKVMSKKIKKSLRRIDRRNQALQIRKHKREEALARKRSVGCSSNPPHFIVVVSLHACCDSAAALELLKTADDTIIIRENEQRILHFSIPRFKQRIAFFAPKYGDLHALLDSVKVANSLLFLLSPEGTTDEYGEMCVTHLFAQGLPAATFALQGLNQVSIKKQIEVKRIIQKKLEARFPDEKFHNLDSSQDALLLLRQMTNQKLKSICFRDRRAHLMAEHLTFELEDAESEAGILKVSGYLRGQPLSVNGLVHLPGWGDFQMKQVDAPTDPYPLVTKGGQSTDMNEDSAVHVLETADPARQMPLESEADVDPMEGEQTWPTEQEIKDAEEEEAKKMPKRKVPKGTSEYQAAWILDSEEEEDGSDDSSDDEDMVAAEELKSESEAEETEEYETISVADGDNDTNYDAAMDMDEDEAMFKKVKEEKLHVMFPDEVDTPANTSARIRFQKYRGLKSFRTSPWDPKENLPSDYARVFSFANFNRTKKKVMSDSPDEGALPGWYITIHIMNVPKAFMDSYSPGHPVVVFGLLPHEQKMSVVHFLVHRKHGDVTPIKSKERLIFQAGYRRFSACPIYSQHTIGDKQKFEKFLPHDSVTVATVYAPIMFPPAPVLLFKEQIGGHHKLVASGSLLSVNPNRVIVKRAVLSGYPFKINKRMAVVRYMFFGREDIMWFKPVELRTKWGRRGHIRDALGTHGHMKCIFDGQLKSQDTVLMNLYKRMYPKWIYESHIPQPPNSCSVANDMDEDEDTVNEMFS